MKVLFLGNMNNNHYRLVKGLRKKGVDAYLWIMNYDYYLPEDVDRHLENNYPDWIKKVNWGDPFSFYELNIHHLIKYQDLLNEFNLIITVHYGLIFLKKLGYKGKTAYLPSGPDINQFPFYLNRLKNLRKRYTPRKIIEITYKHRVALRKCDFHIGFGEKYTRISHKKLKIPKEKTIALGIYIDTNDIKKIIDNISLKSKNKYVEIFSPSRIVLNKKYANDQHILVEAVSKLPSEFRNKVSLKFTSKGSVSLLREYITKYNMEDSVEFLTFVPHYKLYERIIKSDIIFGTVCDWGIYGAASLEAFYCKKPVIQPIDKNYSNIFFSLERPPPPSINVLSAGSLRDEIQQYITNPGPYKKLGRDASLWVEKYHGSGLLDKYIEFFQQLEINESVDIKKLSFNK